MIIATVLKKGGEYHEGHVHALRDMCSWHIPQGEFVCLTDGSPECEKIPLTKGWSGWWSKLELFKLKGPVLYFDLDTVICGNCDHWLEKIKHKDFVILRDVYRGASYSKAMQSSIMYWSGNMSYIYTRFNQNPVFDLPNGDQQFLEQNCSAEYLQDFTDDVVSFKADIQNGYNQHQASVIFFHGKPRPWEQDIVSYLS